MTYCKKDCEYTKPTFVHTPPQYSCNMVVKMTNLPELGEADRNHIYILPDNTAWIMNYEGNGFEKINYENNGTDIKLYNHSISINKEITGSIKYNISFSIISKSENPKKATTTSELQNILPDGVTLGAGEYIELNNGNKWHSISSIYNSKSQNKLFLILHVPGEKIYTSVEIKNTFDTGEIGDIVTEII